MSIFLFLLASPVVLAQEVAPEVSIGAERLRLYDEVSYTPHSVAVEQPASSVQLGETLNKLPGVTVLNQSGPGSLTTVIAPQALGSGSTSISIDDIPAVNPSGEGVNLSLFPSSLIESVEQHTPFYSNLDPTTVTSSSPGGRINLQTLRPPRRGESPWRATVLGGSASTVEGSAAYRGGDESHQWIAGVSGMNTAGGFHYQDPETGQSKERENNDAAGGGALAKMRWQVHENGSVEVLDLFSRLERTNPGALTQPTRDHESDTFNLFGVRYNDPNALGSKDGLFGKMALSQSQIATFESDASQPMTRTVGNYSQLGWIRRDEKSFISVGVDNEYDFLHSDIGRFERDVFGTTATLSAQYRRLRLVPQTRQEFSTAFYNATDGSMSALYAPDLDNEVALSYGLFHVFPSITAISGFRTQMFTLMPNPTLGIERDHSWSLAYTRRKLNHTIYSNLFYSLVHNRAAFVSIPPSSAQVVNVSDVSVLGYTLDGQLFPVEPLALRASATVARAWDRSTGHDLPYKPRLEALTSVSYLFLPWMGATVEEQVLGKRLINTKDDRSLSPVAQTNLRLSAKLWEGVAFFKIANLLDAPGFVTSGFPMQGRSYWLGYSLGQQGI